MRGRGGLLCPRLMTGMWGGRGEEDENDLKDDVDVGVGRGHGEDGAGRSGGGEESVGDLLAGTAGGGVVVDGPCCSSCSSCVSVTIALGAVAVSGC